MSRWKQRRPQSEQRDENEPKIITALKAAGASVYKVSGKRIPDLLVGYLGETFLLEVKNSAAKLPSVAIGKRATLPGGEWEGFDPALRKSQAEFFRDWEGKPAVIIRTVHEALTVIGAPCSCSTCAAIAEADAVLSGAVNDARTHEAEAQVAGSWASMPPDTPWILVWRTNERTAVVLGRATDNRWTLFAGHHGWTRAELEDLHRSHGWLYCALSPPESDEPEDPGHTQASERSQAEWLPTPPDAPWVLVWQRDDAQINVLAREWSARWRRMGMSKTWTRAELARMHRRAGWWYRAIAIDLPDAPPTAAIPIASQTAFGALVREARVAADKSIREVAKDLGITAGQLGEIERGKREPLAIGQWERLRQVLPGLSQVDVWAAFEQYYAWADELDEAVRKDAAAFTVD